MKRYLAILLVTLLAGAWSSFYVSGANQPALKAQSSTADNGSVAEAAELADDELMEPTLPLMFTLSAIITDISLSFFPPQLSTNVSSLGQNFSISSSKTILLI